MVLVTKKKRPTPNAHKRRHGQHHNRDDRYHQAYWPYLPMGLIVGLGVLANTFWGTIQTHVLSYATDMSVSSLLQETNDERVSAGLGGLTLNDKLNQAAQAKANDMAARDYWSHNTPDGKEPWTFFTDAGYNYQTAGENLAYGFGTSGDTVAGWMASPGHKANILNTTYKEVGFGIANAPNYQGTGPETIVVAEYGSPQPGAVASKPAPAPAQTAPAPTEQTPASEPTPAPKEEINATPNKATGNNEAVTPVKTQRVARLQLLSGSGAGWSMFAVSTIAAVCIVIFFLRHGLLWHRVLVKGEKFVHDHPLFDTMLVAIATLAILLSQTDGIIR